MGAETTIKVTREAAMKYLIGKIFTINDDKLSDLLDKFLRERLYNCQIVPESSPNHNHLLE